MPRSPLIVVTLAAAGGLVVMTLAACDNGSPTRPERPATQADCLAEAVFGPPEASPYCLPIAEGSSSLITQAYCSPPSRSHHLRFAWDFSLPFGTDIHAAREGTVVELREHFPDSNTEGGKENVVILEHADGSLGLYIHMQQWAILPELGDFVPQGGLLGQVGTSGTFEPHLHFQVCRRGGLCSTGTTEITLPVNFRNAQGTLDARGALTEGETYTAGPCR